FPAHLVVNVWREYIRKFKLEDLFSPSKDNGLQIIEEMLNQRMKSQMVSALDDIGNKTGEALDSLEFLQLKLRGIEIMEVRIHNVMYDPALEEQTIKQWSGEWLKIAKKEEDLLKEDEKLNEKIARNESTKRFAQLAAKNFENPIQPVQDEFSTLQNLIQPLRETLLDESRANNDMEQEIKRLDEIWKWLLDSQQEPNRQ
ncbi:MAG TPA: hypothetical protein DCY14_12830, partial [Anaerolineae bacterium]|nr:hypothetical protein [Anaerolineae bacterium]